MSIVLLPTAYLPPISWMALAFDNDEIIIEAHETYPKQTFRNRCRIAASNGKLDLTVPVIRLNGNHSKTIDIQIDNSILWQLVHWRSIVTAYNKTPYFIFYRDWLEPVYQRKFDSLIVLNLELLKVIFKIIGIKPDVKFSAAYEFEPQTMDFRDSFHPKKKQDTQIQWVLPRYIQAFESRNGFLPDMSILDLLFNLGPDAGIYLSKVVPFL